MRLLVDVCVTGRILDVGRGSSSHEVERALGTHFLDDRGGRGSFVRRDYGLVELSFIPAEGDWIVNAFSVQVHRLALGVANMVPAAITVEYGPFPETIAFEELAGGIRSAGAEIEKRSYRGLESDARYEVVSGDAAINVVTDATGSRPGPGEVWSISVSSTMPARKRS